MTRDTRLLSGALACALAVCLVAAYPAAVGHQTAANADRPRTFPSPDDAVKALLAAAKTANLDQLLAIFGADGKELASTSDPDTARMNLKVFAVAAKEQIKIEDDGPNRKILVIGGEEWPFPVPLVRAKDGWHFDTAAGKEEILARRVGRNELAVIDTCRAYVTAQKRYAADAHDGKPAGAYAMAFASDPGKQNGLYWPAVHGQKLSPLGELVAQAAEHGRATASSAAPRTPFQGYYFRILTSQGPAAAGGAKDYVANVVMNGGFALVAWPAQYGVTGVMTFIVNRDGVVYEKDLGKDTSAAAEKITAFNPDKTWLKVQ